MGLMDTLRKLNIIRSGGTTATYKSAKDRPISFDKDMFIGKDSSNKSKKSSNNKKQSNKNHQVSKAILITSFVVSFLFIFLALTTTIFWVICIMWVAWLLFVWLLYAGILTINLRVSLSLLLVVLCVVTFISILLTQSDSSGSGSNVSSTKTKSLSAEECKPIYDKYNNTVLTISGDGAKGTIGVKIDTNGRCQLQAWYNVLLTGNLPQNPYKRDIGTSYHYIVLLREPGTTERTKYDEFGDLSPVYKNSTALPEAYAEGPDRSVLYSQGAQPQETNNFYWGYKLDTNYSDERYQEMLKSTQLDIVNGTPFIEEEDNGGGYSWSVNADEAAVNGEIVKTYNLTIK